MLLLHMHIVRRNGVAIAAAKDQELRMFHLDVTCHLHSLCRTT